MPVDWTRIEEGDSLSASNLNTKFDEVTAEVNDLDELSIQPRSLHEPHLPSAVITSASTTIGDVATSYRNEYPGWKDDTWSSSRSLGVTAWTTLVDSTSNLSMPFTTVDLSDPQVAGVLVMANCQLSDLQGLDSAMINPIGTTTVYAFFKIQVQTADTGVWVSIARSEVYADAETEDNLDTGNPVPAQKDISLRAFVTHEDISSYGDTVFQARVVHCVKNRKATVHAAESTVHRCNLSILAFYGKSTVTS